MPISICPPVRMFMLFLLVRPVALCKIFPPNPALPPGAEGLPGPRPWPFASGSAGPQRAERADLRARADLDRLEHGEAHLRAIVDDRVDEAGRGPDGAVAAYSGGPLQEGQRAKERVRADLDPHVHVGHGGILDRD